MKAIIIGASSGIGEALAKQLAKEGYELGLMSRRVSLMEAIAKDLSTKVTIEEIDLTHPSSAIDKMDALILKMSGVDLIIINSGVGFLNPKLEWDQDKQVLDVNVYGFTALASTGFNYLVKQGHGQLVGISSIAAVRGNNQATAYHASKAYVSSYLQGLQKRAYLTGKKIYVTDIRPGFVDTDLAKGADQFWTSTPEKAAEQIVSAIKARRKCVYITKRWTLIAWVMKLMPDWLYYKT